MTHQEAKAKLIEAWGNLGSNWGISRTAAQIHALLMVSAKALTTDDIMEELLISRGNASMSLKTLMEWGVVKKQFVPGQRKEYYTSEKDVWSLATQIAKERQRRELTPTIEALKAVQEVEGESSDIKEFNKMTKNLLKFAKQSDTVLSLFVKAESNKFLNRLIKLLK